MCWQFIILFSSSALFAWYTPPHIGWNNAKTQTTHHVFFLLSRNTVFQFVFCPEQVFLPKSGECLCSPFVFSHKESSAMTVGCLDWLENIERQRSLNITRQVLSIFTYSPAKILVFFNNDDASEVGSVSALLLSFFSCVIRVSLVSFYFRSRRRQQ